MTAGRSNEYYCGWGNYETWCVSERMYKDTATNDLFMGIACDCVRDGEEEQLATHLRDRHREYLHRLELPELLRELLQGAIEKVDWQRIADHLLEDVAEEKEQLKEIGWSW